VISTTGSSALASALVAGEAAFPASDADLMTRFAAGDREAFGALVERHKDGLVAYLSRLTGSRDRAEDLAQEAFLRLFRRAHGYRERGQFTAFLYRIATNLLRDEERRTRRWNLLAGALALSSDLFSRSARAVEPPAPERLLADEARRRVTAELAALPLEWRAPLVLAEIEGWPLAEVARALGCREGTVKSRLFRGRRRLQQALEPYWNGVAR
jgi:RNA polymerase sigma-70 factor, ECF subfamily